MIEQIFIALLGVTSIWLSQSKNELSRKWACIFGLTAQPFWFYSSFKSEQWGILILCFFYSFAWARGVKTHWLSK